MSADTGSGEDVQSGLSRAQLVRRAGMLGAAATLPAVAGAGAADAASEDAAATGGLKALTAAEATTLDAVLQRLLPSDATGPGAKEANVLRYIDWALAGDLAVFRGPYASALASIDAYATAIFGAAFATLAASFLPYMVPFSITITQAAAPQSSLSFIFWGAGAVVLPLILVYTITVYAVFKGKVRPGAEYH